MPGKHAPASPRSFILSVARTVVAVLVVLGVVAGIAVAVLGNVNKKPVSAPTIHPSAHATPTTSATAPIASPSETPSLRAPAQLTIVVLNGTGRAGLAAKVQGQLEKAGFKIVRIGNHAPAAKTAIFYQSSAKVDAGALLDRYPEFGTTKPADKTSAKDALLTIVLGSDYPK